MNEINKHGKEKDNVYTKVCSTWVFAKRNKEGYIAMVWKQEMHSKTLTEN